MLGASGYNPIWSWQIYYYRHTCYISLKSLITRQKLLFGEDFDSAQSLAFVFHGSACHEHWKEIKYQAGFTCDSRNLLEIPKPSYYSTIYCKAASPESSLGDGFKHVLFSPLFGEMIQFDEHILFNWVVQPPTSSLFDIPCVSSPKKKKKQNRQPFKVTKHFRCYEGEAKNDWKRDGLCPDGTSRWSPRSHIVPWPKREVWYRTDIYQARETKWTYKKHN